MYTYNVVVVKVFVGCSQLRFGKARLYQTMFGKQQTQSLALPKLRCFANLSINHNTVVVVFALTSLKSLSTLL